MNELIKLTQQTLNNEEVNTVNARELHTLLEVKSHYKDWFRNRINKYGFQENIDYCCLAKTLATQTDTGRVGSSSYIDHYISLDMAKELCMVENNEKGREARRYFIECEKRLRQSLQPKEECFLDILRAEEEIDRLLAIRRLDQTVIKPLQDKLIEAQPKVTYHDLVLKSEDLMNISQISKDFGLTPQKLNKILHEEGVQYKDKSGVWLLYAEHLDKNYAQTVTNAYEANGKTHTKLHLKWTQTGRLFIYELLKSKGILPVVEKEVK